MPLFLWASLLYFCGLQLLQLLIVVVASLVLIALFLFFVCFACVGCVVGGSFSLRMIATKRKGAPLLVFPLFVRGLFPLLLFGFNSEPFLYLVKVKAENII